MKFFKHALAAAALLVAVPAAQAETVKIGLLLTFSGPAASLGDLMKKSVDLYVKQHQKDLPPGTTVELVVRDETGPNPDTAKRLAQELITRERVNFLAGFIYTPNAMAVAPLATEAKVPMIIMNAGTSVIVRQSPYIARTSFTMWQSGYPLGQWAAKQQGIKTGYTAVADYAPGHDIENCVQARLHRSRRHDGRRGAHAGPGAGLHAVHAAHQGCQARRAVRVRAGRQAGDRADQGLPDLGMAQAGIKLIGPGDITPDEELPNMADVPSGIITTMHHYSAASTGPPTRRSSTHGRPPTAPSRRPSFMAVGAWDGMAAIFHTIREQKGKIDPDKTMELLKGWTNPNSPRGPITIDAETRDIVQNEYLRRLDRVDGKLSNVEIETIEQIKDPWVKFNPPK